MKLSISIIFLITMLIIGCNVETQKEQTIQNNMELTGGVVKMRLTSPAFENDKEIPSEYTCDGSDTSPELNIEYVPKNTKSLVLINDDPDAPVGTWDHWVIFNIPPDTKTIAKGTEPNGVAGKNSWSRLGYGGPCPPSGTHRYFFKLYALDEKLDLSEGATKKEIEAAMQGHVIEKTDLMGTYKRQ